MARGRHRSATNTRRLALERAITTRSQGGGPRGFVAPWVIVAVVLAVVVSGGTFGYLWLNSRCGGDPVTLTVVASPDQADVVSGLAAKWEQDGPTVNGRCARISVRAEESAKTAESLNPMWTEGAAEERVDVWMPDSTAWISTAAQRNGVDELLAGAHRSVASSPVVMAVPEAMAEALGWPDSAVSWSDLAKARVGGVTWQRYGHPEWGQIRIGIGDPRGSLAALGTLLPVADADKNNTVTEAELRNALLLARAVTWKATSTRDFLGAMRQVADESKLGTVGPFPATEREIAAYNATNPKVSLVGISPDEGTVFADYPFVTLKASWVDTTRREIAKRFLDFLQSEDGLKAYGEAGFRDAGQSTRYARGLELEKGLGGRSASTVRQLPTVEAVTKTVVFWTALQRQANLLAVIDTSGSMAEPAPDGSGNTRMQIVQQACLRANALFSPESHVGSWRFSTNLNGDQDYLELVPLGPVGGTLPNGVSRRKALDAVIYQEMRPQGATGLYDTMLAAFTHLQQRWQPGKLNLLVLMTDGKNEDDGISRAELVKRLKQVAQPDKPVQVVVVGFGPDTDMAELTEITAAVGGKAYPASSSTDIDRIFLSTLVGQG